MQKESQQKPNANSNIHGYNTTPDKQMGKRDSRYNTKQSNQTSTILRSKFRRISRARKTVILAFWLFLRSRQKPKISKLIRRKKLFWLLARCALNRSRAHRADAKPPRPVRRRGLCACPFCMSLCMSVLYVVMNVNRLRRV